MKKLALTLMASLMLVGCVAKVLTPVIQKAYDVCVKVETVANGTDTNQFVTVAQEVKTPLVIVKTAVDYLSTKITKESVVKNLVVASETITKVIDVLDEVTPDNVDKARVQVIEAMGIAKESIKFAAASIGVEINTVTLLSTAVDPVADMKETANDLLELLSVDEPTPVGQK